MVVKITTDTEVEDLDYVSFVIQEADATHARLDEAISDLDQRIVKLDDKQEASSGVAMIALITALLVFIDRAVEIVKKFI